VIELKTPAEIERMHVTGRFVAEVLSEVGALADVGVNLLDLEHHVRGMIDRRGADSCYWVAGQCSALRGGGEGPRWEGRQGPSSALTGGGSAARCTDTRHPTVSRRQGL